MRQGHDRMLDLGLPNYFLIDTQPEARLTTDTLTEACRQLKRNRVQYLRDTPTEQSVKILARLADNWRDDLFPIRKLALAHGPARRRRLSV